LGRGDKHFELWLPAWLAHAARRALEPRVTATQHLLFALCDHYEPLWGNASEGEGLQRVERWARDYPLLQHDFRDADGFGPRHTFFFPGEEYRPSFFRHLDGLVRAGAGELELHLHHDGDDEASLEAKLHSYVQLLARHGHLSRTADGTPRYAFIHGNWALANGRPDGQRCGVDAELPLLFATGCYADFTFPSCPDPTQARRVNELYWPVGDLKRRRSYDRGVRARVGLDFQDRLLMVTGPLSFRRGAGWQPKLEYGALQASNPPTPARVHSWVAQHIHVEGRPEWTFVKLYTHGAPREQAEALLGEPGRAMHRILTEQYNDGTRWRLHYVTARELFNVAKAAIAGKAGDPGQYRDYALAPPPILQSQGAEPGQLAANLQGLSSTLTR